jgi:hypothetical protein
MVDVAPAKLSLRDVPFVIQMHRLVTETTIRQFKGRSRGSVFSGQVQ